MNSGFRESRLEAAERHDSNVLSRMAGMPDEAEKND